MKRKGFVDEVEKHLVQHGLITTTQAEEIGVEPKNLAVMIHRLRRNRHLNIVTLDRRKMKWLGQKEQAYQLMDRNPTHEEVASPSSQVSN